MYVTFRKTHQTLDRRLCAVWVCIDLITFVYSHIDCYSNIYILHVEAPSFCEWICLFRNPLVCQNHCETPTKALPFPMPPPRARPATSSRCIEFLAGWILPWHLQHFEPGTPPFQQGIQPLLMNPTSIFKFMKFRFVYSVGVNLIHQLVTTSIFQFLGLFAHTFDLFSPHGSRKSHTLQFEKC